MSSLSLTVDPFSVADPKELQDWRLPLSFMKSRHVEKIKAAQETEEWRIRDRMKTWSVVLCLCLNVGVDPPDVVKTNPCARKECWIDPLSMSPQKALETIGTNLQKQYERWQPRARYKQLLDPTTDDTRKLCISLRRTAKNERVLFHYNAHGVPKPTQNGEIWVFNKSYTQYIPLSMYDLQAWMGSPSIYVYDCSQAGLILDSFQVFARQRDSDCLMGLPPSSDFHLDLNKWCIQLAACGAKEMLPMNPELPADLFTCCLTTPIKTALFWYCQQKVGKLSLVQGVTQEMLEKIPGKLSDRRTPLGELNWIFTAITDTIAWNTLPTDQFQKLFRQDLLVASLFRNFLLAERVMRSYKCTPESHPPLPPTHQHHLWQAWDLTLDHVLSQLPDLLAGKKEYHPSQFFTQQLSAFQVWLMNVGDSRSPPQQLPIVLQFLLSQAHRLQALELLGRFLDLGPWAVHSALTVGIFPYVLKLLGGKLRELQPILMFIWAKILAIDQTCQKDLVKDSGYKYFVQVLGDTSMQYEYRTMAAFALSTVVNKYPLGQEKCLQSGVVALCLGQLEEPNPVLRQWLAICLGRLWQNYDTARWYGARDNAHEKLVTLLWDEIPDVRAATVFALGSYLLNTSEDGTSEMRVTIDQSVGSALLRLLNDGSPIVRMELVAALHGLTLLYEKQFHIAALHFSEGRRISATNLTTSVTATGWIHVTIDPDQEGSSENSGTPSSSSNIQTPHPQPSSTLSSSSLSSSSTITTNSLPGRAHHLVSNGFESTDTATHNGELSPNFTPGGPSSGGDQSLSTSQSRDSLANGEGTDGGGGGGGGGGGREGKFLDELPRGKSGSGSGLNVRNWYQQIWRGMVYLASDPYPEVADLAQHVIHGLHDKLRQKPHSKMIGATLVASYSAPSSPRDTGHGMKAATLGSAGMSKYRHSTKVGMASSAILRVKPEIASVPTGRPKPPSPTPSSSDEESEEGEGTLHALSTQFCDWCCKYFANPLMKQPTECDPASSGYQQREYRFIRNHMMRVDSIKNCSQLSRSRLNDQIFVNRESRPAHLLKFHPYRPHLAVIQKNCWSMWDVEQGSKVTSLQENCTYSTAKITAAEFINPHDISFLLVGSEDGTVHVWRDYCQDGNNEGHKPTLVTAWRGLLDMLPASKRVGMVLEWEQQTGLLYASGDVRHIRVWDTHKEMMAQDIPTHADSSVTCLTSDSAQRSLLIAGCGDGTVRLYDRRQPPASSLVLTLREHQGWIVNVLLQHYALERSIVSCSVGGEVKTWDPRFMKSVGTFNLTPNINVCDIHPQAPLLACASHQQQTIRIFNLESKDVLNTIRYHDGFMGQKIGASNCLAFHPHKILLAHGGVDGMIAIYSTERKKTTNR